MTLLKLITGETPSVWHVVIIKDGAQRSELPPVQSFLATESEVRKCVAMFRVPGEK
jgi:hypothetical protein